MQEIQKPSQTDKLQSMEARKKKKIQPNKRVGRSQWPKGKG